MKDYLKTKKYAAKKEAKKARSSNFVGPATTRQMPLGTVVKTRELRDVSYYVKMCTLADTPLEKTEDLGDPSVFAETLQARRSIIPSSHTVSQGSTNLIFSTEMENASKSMFEMELRRTWNENGF